MSGAFMTTLTRNNKKIREDRALSIAEDAELLYKRKVEDLETQIKRKKRDRENMLDLSPASADSLIVASDFKADDFVAKDLAIGLEIRNLEIALEIAKSRYEYLFGK
jgi:hypothetical protein